MTNSTTDGKKVQYQIGRYSPSATPGVAKGPGEGAGLPIGNLTSQFFANLYLNELDRFVKHELRCRYYIRYMDDFLVFSNDRGELKEIRERMRRFLKEKLKLTLHDAKSQIYATKRGITFLGFRLFAGYRRLAGANVRRLYERIPASTPGVDNWQPPGLRRVKQSNADFSKDC